MRDRLIELIMECSTYTPEYSKQARLHAEYLAQHLLNEGVISPPVKVGDKIYSMSASKTRFYELVITHFVVNENETQIWAVGEPYSTYPAYICNVDDLNNTEWVFLTREQAEGALERSENGTYKKS